MERIGERLILLGAGLVVPAVTQLVSHAHPLAALSAAFLVAVGIGCRRRTA